MTNDEIINTMITGFGTPCDKHLEEMNTIYSSINNDEKFSTDSTDLLQEIKDVCVYSVLYTTEKIPISFALTVTFHQDEKNHFVDLISFTNPSYRNKGYASACISECVNLVQQLKPEPWIFCVFKNEAQYKNKHLFENQHGFLEIPFMEQGIRDDDSKWYFYYHPKLDKKYLETINDLYK